MSVGDIVTVRGRQYRVTGFREDGEPILERVPDIAEAWAAFGEVIIGRPGPYGPIMAGV